MAEGHAWQRAAMTCLSESLRLATEYICTLAGGAKDIQAPSTGWINSLAGVMGGRGHRDPEQAIGHPERAFMPAADDYSDQLVCYCDVVGVWPGSPRVDQRKGKCDLAQREGNAIMITVHNPAPRIANQTLALANKSPTSDQLTTALASAGVTAIKLQATLSTGAPSC